ncbi:hypothetical protein DV735_g3103, partial [Chaetothyriales sp. CBS 134920]
MVVGKAWKAWLLAAFIGLARADVEFLTPAAGSSQSSLKLSITWKESGTAPAITEFTAYQMYLCAGGNDADEYVDLTELVAAGDFSDGNSATATVTTGLGANVKNAYFIKIVSTTPGGAIVNFSDRFSLTGMTGVFPAKVVTALKSVSGTAGPATINAVTADTGEDQSTTDPALYTTPYTQQSGSIRYAPMPPTAPTKITAKAASSQYPTSAYTVYKTYAGTPNAITTHTLQQTFSVSSREATQQAAGQPTGNAMQKFLDRWRD